MLMNAGDIFAVTNRLTVTSGLLKLILNYQNPLALHESVRSTITQFQTDRTLC